MHIRMDRTSPRRRSTSQRRPRRRVARGLVTGAIGLMSATAGLTVGAPPATGQEDPGVVQPREKLQQTQEDANAAHDRYQKALDEQDQVQGQIAALEQAIPEMRAKEAELRSQLATRAAALYKNTDPSGGLEVLEAKSRIQAGRKTKLTETGGFHAGGSDNNFSGLGACDGCRGETRFPTARDGIRAQIQHLRNYADRNSRASDLSNPPSPYWYGADPGTAARNFDTFFAKGWAPIWQMMGHGNWATDPNYASKVTGVYNRMVESRGS